MNNNTKGSGFLNGILIGILIGGGAALLFSTKRGRKLLKVITEEGWEGISGLEEIFEEVEDEYESNQPEQKVSHPTNNHSHASNEHASNGHAPEHIVTEVVSQPVVRKPVTIRRFFRGVPKRG